MSAIPVDLVERAGYIFYHYAPNKWVSVHYAILFLLTLAFEIYLVSAERKFKYVVAVKHRRRYVEIMIPMMIGVLLEAIGYIARAASANDIESKVPYIIQSVMLLVAPAFIVATIYMCLGETIKALRAEQHCFIPVKYLTKIFVCGDVLSFLMQSSGGGIMAQSGQNSANLGKKLIVIGLFVQVAFFGCFTVVMSLFSYKIHRSPTVTSSSLKHTRPTFGNWKHGLLALVISSLFILIRSVYRIVEYIQGNNGYLQSHEVFLFVFDSVLILLSVTVLETSNFTRFFCSAKAEDNTFDNEMNPLRQ